MIEHGVVTKMDGRTATVEVCDQEAEHCHSCTASCESKKTGKSWQVEADEGMQVGSRITLLVKIPSMYVAVALLFLVPLALLVAGIAAGQTLFGSDLGAFGLGIVLFIAGFGGAWLFESQAKRKGRYRPVVIEVYPPAEVDRD